MSRSASRQIPIGNSQSLGRNVVSSTRANGLGRRCIGSQQASKPAPLLPLMSPETGLSQGLPEHLAANGIDLLWGAEGGQNATGPVRFTNRSASSPPAGPKVKQRSLTVQGQPGIRTVVPDETSKNAPIHFNACGVAGRDDAYAAPRDRSCFAWLPTHFDARRSMPKLVCAFLAGIFDPCRQNCRSFTGHDGGGSGGDTLFTPSFLMGIHELFWLGASRET